MREFNNQTKVKLPPDNIIKELIDNTKDDKTLFHPLTFEFPLMSFKRIKVLVLDIKLNGLERKITKTKDRNDGKIKIIDGRQRYIACLVADVKPQYEIRKDLSEIGKILFVVSVNLHRRHLKLPAMVKIAYNLYNRIKELRNEKPTSSLKAKINSDSLKKVEMVEEKTIINAIAKSIKTKPITLQQGIKILEKADKIPRFRKLWDEVVEEEKSINQAHSELEKDKKVKPLKRITQIEINTKLRNELKKTERELKQKGKSQESLEKRYSKLEAKCKILEDKLIQIKKYVEEEIEENRIKNAILKIIGNGNGSENRISSGEEFEIDKKIRIGVNN